MNFFKYIVIDERSVRTFNFENLFEKNRFIRKKKPRQSLSSSLEHVFRARSLSLSSALVNHDRIFPVAVFKFTAQRKNDTIHTFIPEYCGEVLKRRVSKNLECIVENVALREMPRQNAAFGTSKKCRNVFFSLTISSLLLLGFYFVRTRFIVSNKIKI